MANRILLLLAIASRNDPNVSTKVLSEIAGMSLNPVFEAVVSACTKVGVIVSACTIILVNFLSVMLLPFYLSNCNFRG